jgi:leader peptidase (prepilin peptidase)/N-methyltransferase
MVGEVSGLPLPVPWLAFAFALGLVLGSFLNVVAHRLPRGESVVRPGSRCPACARSIRPWENVPVLSWLLLRGRCRGCSGRISWRYPLVELSTGLLFLLVAARYGASPFTPLWMLFAAALLAAALIDFEHQIIPDEVSLGGLLAGLLLVPLLRWEGGAQLGAACLASAGGALLGGGMLWLVGFLHARVSVAMGRSFDHWPGVGEELPRLGSVDYWTWFPGMGFGDVKLLAMIGAFLGPLGVVTTVLAASLLGLLFGLGWALATRSWDSPFGFGPALAGGALVALLTPTGFLW